MHSPEFERLDDALRHACQRFADAEALLDATESMTYSALLERAETVAVRLRAAGLQPGQAVIIESSNSAADLVWYFATWLAGGVAVPVAVNATGDYRAHVEDRVAGGVTLGPEGLATRAGPTVVDERMRDAALVVFTSGSTALPKGVMLGHSRYLAKLKSIADALPFEGGTDALLVLRLTFSFGIWFSLLTLLTGGRLLVKRSFDPADVLDSLASRPVHRMAVVPTMLRLLAPHLRERNEAAAPELLLVGGEVMPEPLGRWMRERWPQTGIADVYGLTETASADFILAAADYDAGAGSIGVVSTPRVKYRICDTEGRPVDDSVPGELQIKTPFLMLGYVGEPPSEDEFFRTGDLATQRPDGRVAIVGRVKSVINRGGNKVSPLAIEVTAATHPHVIDALVTGVPDDTMGERILLAVIASAEVFDVPGIRERIGGSLAPYMQPDFIVRVDTFPVNASGKKDRRALAFMFAAGDLTLDQTQPCPAS